MDTWGEISGTSPDDSTENDDLNAPLNSPFDLSIEECRHKFWQKTGIILVSKVSQRVLNRWSQFSEQKLRFFSKMKILKNAFNKEWGA